MDKTSGLKAGKRGRRLQQCAGLSVECFDGGRRGATFIESSMKSVIMSPTWPFCEWMMQQLRPLRDCSAVQRRCACSWLIEGLADITRKASRLGSMERVYNIAHKVVVGGLVLATVGMAVATTHDGVYIWYNRRRLRHEFLAQQEAEKLAQTEQLRQQHEQPTLGGPTDQQ